MRVSRQTVTALVVRVPSLVERLRQGRGLRAELRGLGRRAIRQVVGRFPRLVEWIGAATAVQRQTMAGSGRAAPGFAPTGTVEDIEPLIAAIRDPSAEVAIAAVVALGKRPEQRVTAVLVDTVRNADGFLNPLTQAAAIRCLAGREGSDDLVLWSNAVHAVDAELSLAAIEAIVTHKQRLALSLIGPVLEDSSGYFLPTVRVAAATALVRTGLLTHAHASHLLLNESDLGVRTILEGCGRSVQTA